MQQVGLIYVVPSHQFPTGSVLTIRRRLELLCHARSCGAYIIEDDYDSEFRYEGEPIQTLRHLDPERVVYLGSFSKIFSPTLRMGYMILPWEAIERMRLAMESVNMSVPVLLQRALALFLHSGQLEHHIYKMKRLYSKKRLLLIKELKRTFGDTIRISGENAGMHLMVTFKNRSLCKEDFEKLRAGHVEAEWSEDYAVQKGAHESGMILGYGALTEGEISLGVARLRKALYDI
jgi:GntR family transcriptional regulator/MocR family aminotransferase